MTRAVFLKVDNFGAPVAGSSSGVITLPSAPLDPNYKEGDILLQLHIIIEAGSTIANKGDLWHNVPSSFAKKFERDKFYQQKITCSLYEDTVIAIPIYKPGSFSYFISYQDEELDVQKTTRQYYFISPPNIYINGSYLPFNNISLQSVVSKWMGNDLVAWERIFDKISKKGYNMIHFTPLQSRGESNSPYSIYDQLQFDPTIFNSETEVEQMVSRLHEEHGILSMTDVVWNHTANNSAWLRSHPEAGYNRETSPHLISAIELDLRLKEFSNSMANHGYPTIIKSTDDILTIMDGIKVHVLGDLKLWQFYVLDVRSHVTGLREHWETSLQGNIKIGLPQDSYEDYSKLAEFVKDTCLTRPFHLAERNANRLDISSFACILASILDTTEYSSEVENRATRILNEINLPQYKIYDEDSNEILEQLFNRIKYLRLEEHGPQLGEITTKTPLTEPYFTVFKDKNGKQWELANNGWIWGGNPLVDFASRQAKSYLRREVIIWGDCVKLRYGSGPDDSPYLWNRMVQYTRKCAKIFDGFRIDNCHSTPLHVGEALLDAAREVNPNLYVVAELFSGSEELDILFVERLAICSLIREAMQAYSVGELSRLLHRHGGGPIGSLRWLPLDEFSYPATKESQVITANDFIDKASEIPVPRVCFRNAPHALFMDCTHDNEVPNQKRKVEDTLTTAALVSFCSCAVGSVYGYDECFPELLDLVNEKRLYNPSSNNGIPYVKSRLSYIREFLSHHLLDHSENNEVHVHHEGQFVTVHRTNSKTGRGYFLIARTKFEEGAHETLPTINLSGTRVNHEFSFSLRQKKDYDISFDPKYLPEVPVDLVELSPPQVSFNESTKKSCITLPEFFPQGSITILSTLMESVDEELEKFTTTGAIEATEELSLIDLQAILYRCESEERDASAGRDGTYDIPGHGRLVYAGLQGWISVLKDVIKKNDLAHPICEHLREGSWACDYVTNRLNKFVELSQNPDAVNRFRKWLRFRMDRIKQVPYFLLPRYFCIVIGVAYEALRFRALSLMSPMIQTGTRFLQNLSLVSVQMVGCMNSASLTPKEMIPSMAAGLPHFSYDYMRCWGRDIFLSLRGLLLATGRYDEAKSHLVNCGKTLKHGLIPNLIGSGAEPRFNARDAVWFYAQSIQDYVREVPNGHEILQEKVERRFLPFDDSWFPISDQRAYSVTSTIEELLYEILSRHASGISYREANAGPNLDSQMSDEGFNVRVTVDWNNGLIFGGNQYNCGTWMDKMGESESAGNKGIPGTPRDGAAIEIIGLLKSTLQFVVDLQKRRLFKFSKVTNQHGNEVTFENWNALVAKNFERCFYVPENPSDDGNYDLDSAIINRRGIYKDLYRSGKPYEDYQLRPNFCIAMCVAPELFTPSFALNSLKKADILIRGPIGMSTLDPSDLNYRPYYNNSEDSTDFATAKGRNYHQGPEWVWLTGFFLRAFRSYHLKEVDFCRNEKGDQSTHLDLLLSQRLSAHRSWIAESVWAGLTELTNKGGSYCPDSSPTQAWSAATLIELYHDIYLHED
ncbi:hypothetical protein LJB42_001266 [Komagataella kurtzmanii]|nr:hypothetical protein LJB42_001266 [Komagataella kurtzmanii]